MQIPDEVIGAAAWALIENDTDTADRGVSDEHYRERMADVRLAAPVIAEWARKEAVAERDEALKALTEAEAVIQKVRDDAADWLKAPRGEMASCTGVGRYFTALVSESRSVVLADHDKEVAARGLRDWADWIESASSTVIPPGEAPFDFGTVVRAMRSGRRPFGIASGRVADQNGDE